MNEFIKDSRVECLIFDLDGTLVDSRPVFFIAWRNLLKEHDIVFNRELFDEMAGMPMRQCVAMINDRFQVNLDKEEVVNKIESELLTHMHLIQPIKPVCNIVYQFAGKIPMAIGTGSQRENAKKILKQLELSQYFDVVVAAEDVKEHKPLPETFLKCAEQLGIKPEFCHVFEDAQKGINAARSAGMNATDVTKYYEVKIGEELY